MYIYRNALVYFYTYNFETAYRSREHVKLFGGTKKSLSVASLNGVLLLLELRALYQGTSIFS